MTGTTSRRSAFAAVAAGLTGVRRCALTGYRWLLLAFLLAGCTQIFLAGLGVLSFGDLDVITRPGVLPDGMSRRWGA